MAILGVPGDEEGAPAMTTKKKMWKMQDKVDALHGVMRETRCVCRLPKKVRSAFCSKCLKVLGAQSVRAMRYRLQAQEIDALMVEGYEECLAWLIANAYVREGATL